MANKENIIRFESLTQLLDAVNWEKPNHPLITIIDVTKLEQVTEEQMEVFKDVKMTSNLYSIILKDGDCGMRYGRNKYDFEEGVLRFIGPNQVVSSDAHTPSNYGFMLIFHPDLLRNFELGRKMKEYTFFNYSVHEALHLSKQEEDTLIEVANNIKKELNSHIDKHSQEVLVTNIQLMLNYSKRFYERQFITRANTHSDVISEIEELIQNYYNKNMQVDNGLPSPEYLAEQVNFSPNYLGELLKKETGKSTKDHVDGFVLELAKTELVSSRNTISEIAYNLGYNYPHYFSRMFKKKTGETPHEYRSKMLN